MTGTVTAEAGQVAKGHILLIEDDEACGEAYRQVLCRAGFQVYLAPDFRMALEVLEAKQPLDLLLADIVMPGSVNGIALSRMARIRRRDLKVVYMTGYHIPGVEAQALGPVLRKPIGEGELVREIERALAIN